MTITWIPEIDWDKDGAFDNEAARLLELTVRRGRSTTVANNGYAIVEDGECVLTLSNHDQRFDPYYVSGPLYGHILPDRPFRLTANDGTLTHDVFTGRVREPRPQSGEKIARIACVDGIDFLKKQKCGELQLQSNYEVSQAITDLLIAAGWPYVDTSGWCFPAELGVDSYLGSTLIENNGDDIPYWWADPEKSVWEALSELAQAFSGDIYIAADGTFGYSARSFGRAVRSHHHPEPAYETNRY